MFYSLEDVRRAVRLLQEEGVVNFSIDLISSLPGQARQKTAHMREEGIGREPARPLPPRAVLDGGCGWWYAVCRAWVSGSPACCRPWRAGPPTCPSMTCRSKTAR